MCCVLWSFAAPNGFDHIRPKSTMKDGISKVKDDIKGVMGIMQGNISKVLDRGAKLEDLQDKSGAVHVCSMMATVHTYIHVNRVSNVIVDEKMCSVTY